MSCFDIVPAHGDGGNAITPLDEWVFRLNFSSSDLAQWNRLSVPSRDGEIFQLGRIKSLRTCASHDYVYRANVLANLSDGLAVQEKLQLLRRLCGRETNELQSLLIQNEVQLGHAFAPIHIHRAQVRIVAHDFFDVVGDLAQLDGISPRHSKRDRERRVRTKDQLRRANPRFRREAIGGGLAQARFEMIPCLCIRRQNDNLRTRDRATPGCRKRKTVEHPRRCRQSRSSLRIVATANVRSSWSRCSSSRCSFLTEAEPQPTIPAGPSLEKIVSSQPPCLRPPRETQ